MLPELQKRPTPSIQAPVTHHSRFQPYSDNGGNVVAIAGDDYCVVASDTRLTTGYQIYTRNQSKLIKVTNKTILGSTGCWCDVVTFGRILDSQVKMYSYDHNQEISCQAVSQLVAIMLYNRRFFPYYISNIVAGVDDNGKGYVYSYDPVGHCENSGYRASGSAVALMQPFLDNQVGQMNMEGVDKEKFRLSLEDAIKITKDALTSATERDINCGDGIHLCVITKDGIREEKIEMRKD